MDKLQLVAFELYGHELWEPLVPAARSRTWMDNTPDKFAYKCLPLTLANQAGWFVLCPTDIHLLWDGGLGPEALQLEATDEQFLHHRVDGERRGFVASHFGSGIVTFSLPWFFRTSQQGIGLKAEGAPNTWIPGMHALTGLVETWGHVSTFTMNWKVYASNIRITIPRGFPICFLSLYDFGLIDRHEALVGPRVLMPEELDLELRRWDASREADLEGTPNPFGCPHQHLSYIKNRTVTGEKVQGPHWKSFDVPPFVPVAPMD